MPILRAIPAILAASLLVTPAIAQDRETPYWASIRAEKVNMRVGPSESYRIDWVYERPQLPLKVLRIKEGWRLVEDADGDRGWVVARFLSRDRTAIVVGGGPAPMRAKPQAGARLLWNAQPGVVGKLGDCDEGWCRFDVTGRVGWIPQKRLWGSGEPRSK
ncbi:MAG: SH3 domain-containing protein [Novosphingobium sp.]|nr:SH3 domain-containing protein [Novosphingobium sp.]